MRRLIALLGLFITLVPAVVSADASLQLNPLKYEDSLPNDTVKQGFVEVSNPSDTSITVTTSVRGFKQADLDGNLAFFDDPQLTAGIIPDLPSFVLGPREAIRVTFSVNPSKLPKGGVYAALFFRTQPEAGSSNVSYLLESANIGTLLLLQNGASGKPSGDISKLSIPLFQFGNGIKGSIVYNNSDRNTGGTAITPRLSVKIPFFGQNHPVNGSLVLPQSSRNISFSLMGSYFGVLPIQIAATGTLHRTAWIIVCTGWYSYALLVIIIALLAYGIWRIIRRFRRPSKPLKRTMVRDIKPLRKP
ncbi:MAG: hypothetical protein ABIS59_00660, partial [Candidatus Saccharibacteria bacterium]